MPLISVVYRNIFIFLVFRPKRLNLDHIFGQWGKQIQSNRKIQISLTWISNGIRSSETVVAANTTCSEKNTTISISCHTRIAAEDT